MSDYSEFFLNSKSSVVGLELLEISHSAFTQTYFVVRNAVNGVTIAPFEDRTSQFFQYYPLAISPIGAYDDLDQSLKITLGDLGSILPVELDAVSSSNGFSEKPMVRYWVYRSDDLTQPVYGPLVLEVKTFTFNREGSQFVAKAPTINNGRTGELYTLDRFPMLRGCL